MTHEIGVEQKPGLRAGQAKQPGPSMSMAARWPAGDLSALLQHLQRTAGNQAVNGLLQRWTDQAEPGDPRRAGMPEMGARAGAATIVQARYAHAVQRQPPSVAGAPAQADTAPATVQSASVDVVSAYKGLFDNQRSGLDRLGKALQKKKADNDLVAGLAAAAVGAALAAVLGPIGPAAEALVLAEDEVGRALVKKTADLVIDKAVEKAKDGVKEHFADTKKTDPIDNFVESQSLAINRAERAAVHAFASTVSGYEAVPNGPAVLQGMANAIDAQADSANSLQIAHSAGAWASLIAEPGDDAKAWANDDYERYAEKGALEIEASVAAPIKGAGDIHITGSNWRGINKETERVLQEHGGAKIQDLGVNLRITIATPVGETRCEIPYSRQGNPIIPEKSALQGVMAWLFTGKMNPSPSPDDRMAVASGAAALGYYVLQKPVSELHFA